MSIGRRGWGRRGGLTTVRKEGRKEREKWRELSEERARYCFSKASFPRCV